MSDCAECKKLKFQRDGFETRVDSMADRIRSLQSRLDLAIGTLRHISIYCKSKCCDDAIDGDYLCGHYSELAAYALIELQGGDLNG